MTTRIREARPADITNRSLRRYLHETRETTRRYLCKRDGFEAGFVEIELATGARRLEVTQIVVVPRFRGTGVGKALLRYAENKARRLGYQFVLLRAHSLDPRAMSTGELQLWYQRHGYQRVIGPSYPTALRKRLF